jgi:hypothetical protein
LARHSSSFDRGAVARRSFGEKSVNLLSRYLAAILSTTVPSAHAAAGCAALQTQQQRPDKETIVRIEHEWLEAEYRGNQEFLDCLLTTGYMVVVAKNQVVHSKADLIERIGKNKGKTTPIPTLETIAIVNGDQATAFSVMHGKKSNGEALDVKFVDSYVFKDGLWHAVGGVDLDD